MRRVAGLLIPIAALACAAFWFTSWATNTCQPIDRLSGQSGCAGTIEITDFSPLFRGTMVVTGADGMASLLGWQLDDQGNRISPKLIRLNPRNGHEAGRVTLAIGEGFDHAVFSADGQKALLTCTTRRNCAADGSAAAIISTIDGRQLALVDEWEAFPRIFPGDPLPPAGFSPFAMLVSNSAVVVDEDDSRNIVMTELSTGRIVQLAAQKDRRDSYAPRFVISPDQARIALTSTTYGRRTIGDRFWVWDADGSEVMSMAGSPDYRFSSNATWSYTGDALFIMRKTGRNVLIDRFVVP